VEILLEIGMEELPARFLNSTLNKIEKNIKIKLEKERIKYDGIKTYGTPRRLILHIDNLDEKQEDLSGISIGPAKRIAYDSSGEPTKAAIGFAKSQGAEITDLELIKNERGEYLAFSKFIKGKKTEEILEKILKEIILDIEFPKTMRWGTKKIKFARPLRWILALANDKIVEFEIEGIKSEAISYGHRFFGSKSFEVETIRDYFQKVEENYVIIDIEKRKQRIVDAIEGRCSKVGEKVLITDDLLNEVANLIEYPYPIVGTFNAEFLEVPQEVLIITMQTHQKYFPVLDTDGKLLPKFVVVRNGIDFSENVKKGNEKVLTARLADARFFYQEDLKIDLNDLIEKLKTVVFQKELGTIYNKIERSKMLAHKISNSLNVGETKKIDVERTIDLAKVDLVTNMISEKEYTKLQGFMGMDYALNAGEKDDVAKGIFEHYLPRYSGDILPKTMEGVIAGISDKIDTIVGCFGINLIPSGSEDPYALRRAAMGIVTVILDSSLDISLYDLIDWSIAIFEEKGILKREKSEIKKDILEFFKARIKKVNIDKGYRRDIVEAVISVDYENLLDLEEKIKTLEKISKEEDFDDIILLIKRVRNILKKFSKTEIDEKLIKEKEEKELYEYYKKIRENTNIYIVEKNYEKFFFDILNGKEIINNFFDKVMVMDKDDQIKENRLSLIKALDNIFNEIAIMSKIN